MHYYFWIYYSIDELGVSKSYDISEVDSLIRI